MTYQIQMTERTVSKIIIFFLLKTENLNIRVDHKNSIDHNRSLEFSC